MRSRIRLAYAAILAIGCLTPSAALAQAALPGEPATTMASGILIDLEANKVLWSKDAEAARAPASLTKVLTALTVLEHAGSLQDTAVISETARNAAGGRMFAEQGWTFTIEDLLWGLMLQSGNDAAITLAEKISPDGTVAGFMKLANAKAVELGALRSSFMNPHGLDEPGHMSTAKDLAIITAAAMQNPVFARIAGSKTHNVPWGDGKPHMFINHNKLLWRAPGAVGVKTGFTDDAGNCLISAVQRHGSTLVAVVMGTPHHYADSIALFDWGFANLGTLNASSAEVMVKPASATPAQPVDRGLVVTQTSSGGLGKVLLPALALLVLTTLGIAFRERLLFSRT
ncbi:MAG: D-alanyl-D-alanine carboxypeptidase family protein [Actinomycetota bacterium]